MWDGPARRPRVVSEAANHVPDVLPITGCRKSLRLTDHARYSLEPEIRQTPTPSVIRGLDYPAAETPVPDRTITRRGRISGVDSSPRRLRAEA
jgi:hypothetical protein